MKKDAQNPKSASRRSSFDLPPVSPRDAAGACFVGSALGCVLGSLGPASMVQFLDPAALLQSYLLTYGISILFSFPLLLLLSMLVGPPLIRAVTRRITTNYPVLFASAGFVLALLIALPLVVLYAISSRDLLESVMLFGLTAGYGASTGLGTGLQLRYPDMFS